MASPWRIIVGWLRWYGAQSTRFVSAMTITRPDDHQAVLLARLGLKLPNHIKRFSQEDQAIRS